MTLIEIHPSNKFVSSDLEIKTSVLQCLFELRFTHFILSIFCSYCRACCGSTWLQFHVIRKFILPTNRLQADQPYTIACLLEGWISRWHDTGIMCSLKQTLLKMFPKSLNFVWYTQVLIDSARNNQTYIRIWIPKPHTQKKKKLKKKKVMI